MELNWPKGKTFAALPLGQVPWFFRNFPSGWGRGGREGAPILEPSRAGWAEPELCSLHWRERRPSPASHTPPSSGCGCHPLQEGTQCDCSRASLLLPWGVRRQGGQHSSSAQGMQRQDDCLTLCTSLLFKYLLSICLDEGLSALNTHRARWEERQGWERLHRSPTYRGFISG